MVSSISPDDVIKSLPISSKTQNIWLGFSGGVDSHVLLYLLSKYQSHLQPKTMAIHVNHSLNPRAEEWSRHCQKVCSELGLEIRVLSIDARSPAGESPEAWARKLRYQAISGLMEDGDILLTAHHKDDMAETLLLQLLRGAGPAGLSAMPEKSSFVNGWHCRPLLAFTRLELVEFAEKQKLSWIEDNSNLDDNFDRNYLRNKVIPIIRHRWPALAQTLTRSAKIQAESSSLMEDLAEIDLTNCLNLKTGSLMVPALELLSEERIRNVIRYWIKSQGHPTPNSAHLGKILKDVLKARVDAEPCVSWDGVELRRYRESLFITRPLPDNPGINAEIHWQFDSDCHLIMGRLRATRGMGNGIRVEKCPDQSVLVKYRRGSEMIKKNGHHHKLKKLYQEIGVPSCYRDFIPLIYINEKLVAVSGLYIDEEFSAAADEDSYQIHWSRAAEIFAFSTS